MHHKPTEYKPCFMMPANRSFLIFFYSIKQQMKSGNIVNTTTISGLQTSNKIDIEN